MKAIVLLAATLTLAACNTLAPDARTSNPGHFTPDQIQWLDGPTSLPPGAKYALLEGDPAKNGLFTMRVRLPQNYRIAPHTHPNVERVTVLSGTLFLTMTDSHLHNTEHTLPAGSYLTMPPGMRHHARTQSPTELQLTSLGPWAINYLNPNDDPRKNPKPNP